MPYRVVVVGAGFGGIGMAIALKQAGIEDFVVLDKADDLGGTWRDNSYPGLCCDVPSQLYSYSFRPWHWSRRFPPREEILAYLHGLVAERGLGPHLRFGCGVAAADLTSATPSGTSPSMTAKRYRPPRSSAPSASSAALPCPISAAGTSSPVRGGIPPAGTTTST